MATNIGTAFFNVTFNTAAARREITALVSSTNRSLGLVGGISAVIATTAFAGLIRATEQLGQSALQASIDYEQAFASVRKTVDDGTLSAAQATAVFGQLSEELRGLALEIPVDLEDGIAKVAELGGQLGIPAASLQEFSRIINEVGVTTNVVVENAATSFARIANILGLTDKDFRVLGDTLINLGNKLPAQEDEILNFANRIAAAGKISGFTADEVLAVGAAFASVGVKAERGGTAIQKTWIKITQAVAEGGSTLDLIAQVSGETSEEFQKHWQEDAAGAWVNFVEGLGRAGTDAFGILKDLELSDARVTQALLSIASAGDLMRRTFEIAGSSAGALATESALFFNTTQGQLQLLQNRFHDAGITIGDSMKPAFRDIVASINDFISANPELIDQIGTRLTGALESLGDVVATLLPILGDLLAATPVLIDQFLDMVDPILNVGAAFADAAARAADFFVAIDQGAAEGDFWATLGQVFTQSLPEQLRGGVDIGRNFVDSISADLARQDWDELNRGEKLLRAFFPPTAVAAAILGTGDAARGALLDVRDRLVDDLAQGAPKLDAVAEALIRFQTDLIDVAGPAATLTTDMFDTIVEGAKLSERQLLDLIPLLHEAGIQIPESVLARLGLQGASQGHPNPRQLPQGFVPLTDEELDLQEETDALEEAAVVAKTLEDAFKALRQTQESLGASTSTIIDNWQRLAPPDLRTAIEQFGEGEIKARLFADSLTTLANNIEFQPATKGMFGIGPLTEQIQMAERTLADSGEKVKLHGKDVAKNIVANLNTIAEFEADLTILAARGFDQLALTLAAAGPEMAHAADDFVSGLADPAVVEAALDAGGTISDETVQALSDALGGEPVPQELLDLVASFGSNQVQSAVYREAYASGQQYGSGFMAGVLSQLGGLAGILGIRVPALRPPGWTGGDVGRGGELRTSGVMVQQNFYTEPRSTPETQRSGQEAAAVLSVVR